MNYKILVINPGSTSTKIALYEDEKEVFCKTFLFSFKYSISPKKNDLINKFLLLPKLSIFFRNVMTRRAIENKDPTKRAA